MEISQLEGGEEHSVSRGQLSQSSWAGEWLKDTALPTGAPRDCHRGRVGSGALLCRPLEPRPG